MSDECWVEFKIGDDEITIYTNFGDLYELGAKIVAEAKRLGAVDTASEQAESNPV